MSEESPIISLETGPRESLLGIQAPQPSRAPLPQSSDDTGLFQQKKHTSGGAIVGWVIIALAAVFGGTVAFAFYRFDPAATFRAATAHTFDLPRSTTVSTLRVVLPPSEGTENVVRKRMADSVGRLDALLVSTSTVDQLTHQAITDLSAKIDGDTLRVQVKKNKDDLFARISDFPARIAGIFPDTLRGQWIRLNRKTFLDQSGVQLLIDSLEENAATASLLSANSQAETRDRLIAFIREWDGYTVLESPSPLALLFRRPNAHYALRIDREALVNLFLEMQKIVSSSSLPAQKQLDEAALQKSFASFPGIRVDAWLNAGNTFVERAKVALAPVETSLTQGMDGAMEKMDFEFEYTVQPLTSDLHIETPLVFTDIGDVVQGFLGTFVAPTSPQVPGLSGFPPSVTESSGQEDTDGDGVSDFEEITMYGSDHTKIDTDGDGYLDGEEIANGYNPNGEGKLTSSTSVLQVRERQQLLRDKQRISGILQIQTALELYYSDQNGYPKSATAITLGAGTAACLGWNGFGPEGCENAYMSFIPKNPEPGGRPYAYSSPDRERYSLLFTLEAGIPKTPQAKWGTYEATQAGITWLGY